ncbi:PAS domain S-box protein [Massilia sp. 9096]|uniref:PAS domain-containing hybrid sensor histidine kinase/response regulator n=1 Tax=Massilia sp. 9096 TaxID=1500894 RepID=UPI0006904AA6|nr:PAS domain S-box protein [Massilia sp. 9096]
MNTNPAPRPFAEASAFHAEFNRTDWGATPLGPPAAWPAALRANVGMMLDARVAMGMVWGPQRCLIYNAGYTALLGEKDPWAQGRPIAEVWAEIWPQIEPLVEGAYAGGSPEVHDVPLNIRRNGVLEQGWFTIFCSPLRDDAGQVRGMTSTVIESTARMRAEIEVHELNRTLDQRVIARTAELERSQAHLQSLIRQTAAGFVEADLELRILSANDTFCRIVGRAREDVIGQRVDLLTHPDDRAANRVALGGLRRSGQPFEIENRLLRPDGAAVWVNKIVSPIFEAGQQELSSVIAVVVDVSARREAEARSRDNAERLQLAAEAANLGIWSWDAQRDRAAWENERMFDIMGVARGEEPLSSERFMAELAHPDDVEPYRRALTAAIDDDRAFHFEGRYRHRASGEWRWLEFTGRLHRTPDGRPHRVIGTAADISARKRLIDQLRDAQARLEATLSAGEIGTWMFDLARYKLHADANMAHLHGLSAAEVADASPLAYLARIHTDDLPAIKAGMARARASRELYDCIYRVRGMDGCERVVHARGKVEFEDGQPVRLPGVVIDITRQRAMEAQLREREQRYRTLISSIDEGFCVIELIYDAQGNPVDHRFLETNQAYSRHTGLPDVVGKTARQVAPDIEHTWHKQYAQVAASGEPMRIVQYAEPLGRWFDVFIARAEPESTDKVAIIFRDITAQKQADEALRRLADDLARANRRQNEFLATLAHELRNPLAPIRTGLDLMRLNPGNAASLAKVRGMMERQVNHLIHLVNDLLDLARIQSGKIELKREHVVLQEVAANAVEAALPQVQARTHTLTVDAPPQPMVLDADPNRLVQVIANLLTNAAKYTPEGGNIALALRVERQDALIDVSDNGIGIPADALPTLFEMFSQSRHGRSYAQGGLGIGLSLVKSLAEQHGGSVAAASAGPGQGSRFTLRLPLAPDAPSSAQAGHPEPGTAVQAAPGVPPHARARLRILIADDNRDAAELLAQSLQLEGHTVDIVHDGRAALAAMRESKPDLALLDIGMPGMNGYELAEAIRREPAFDGVMLAAVTGWGAEEDRERSRRAGFDRHLTKPVDLASIAALAGAIAAGKA